MRERITLEDNLMSAIVKMSGGNPGAVTALFEAALAAPKVDPDNAFGAFGPIFALDTNGIYESRIWMLYKDVCGQDVTKLLTILRGVQLGVLSHTALNRAIDGDDGYGSASLLPITFAQCLDEVRATCHGFAAGTTF